MTGSQSGPNSERVLLSQRLKNQKLVRSNVSTAQDLVAWLGAIQAQDYGAAKWAVSLRTNGLADAALEQTFGDGAILRTHVLRPTWHFVSPADIRWMISLTAARINAFMGSYHRKLGLDAAVFARSRTVLTRALKDGKHLTRAELAAALDRAGIAGGVVRLSHLMMQAELDQVICSGARVGKQFTYALFDDRVRGARTLNREDALGELTRRYFAGHGPATLRDYAWWSGLSMSDARRGLEMIRSNTEQRAIGGVTYWYVPASFPAARDSPRVLLLPNYDEYLIAYKDRGPVVGSQAAVRDRPADAFSHCIVVDGRLAGTWRRTLKPGLVSVELSLYGRLSEADGRALAEAAERYGTFLDKPVALRIQ